MFRGGREGGMGVDQGKAMEASFKEFLARPENAAVVEKQQRKEVRQALSAQERAQLEGLRSAVLGADFEAQRGVAPFLRTPCLRRVVQSFANDPRGDFSAWAANPRVLEMLAAAQALLDSGSMTEAEMEHVMLAQLRDPSHEAHAEFQRKARRVARLPTDALVGALNEHLTERRKGNELYRARRYEAALAAYTRAAAVVEFVEGLGSADQAEVVLNRVAVYNNIAAVHLEQKDYGLAVEFCDKVLALDPDNARARLRRAKANVGRHQYGLADADLADADRASGGWPAAGVEEVRAALARARREGAASERNSFGRMFAQKA
ncbi:Peptidyl-prolyl cis-trans isomerase D [Auxenochlorella protothecoides]|uniref:Peptidyl-prolyl cis-trans isomerase D n=1 Tax=Auxenochlorella protothecoides TaxID=3075 RepID=A0A087SDF6_AUXPR|nr:Peptidyl-prolyl cis-trans isomerase D [Auxenochlorella protothecoides]KFM23760.1 Peptidyl-prolyl cis-trans isomerase D [Auxenochlorella protothecoides]